MGIPTRFSTEYPARCLELIGILEAYARDRRLVGSFSLLAAASVLTVPFERARDEHFLHHNKDNALTEAIHSLRKTSFADAPFWSGAGPADWYQGHIVANCNEPDRWTDRDGKWPFDPIATNVIGKKSASEVLRAIRNALAHGNIVYLNKDGREQEGTQLHFLALLSRYEETPEQKEASETYRLIVTTEDEFLRFVKCWARWIADLAREDRDVQAA